MLAPSGHRKFHNNGSANIRRLQWAALQLPINECRVLGERSARTNKCPLVEC
jgi:hypothetical protein